MAKLLSILSLFVAVAVLSLGHAKDLASVSVNSLSSAKDNAFGGDIVDAYLKGDDIDDLNDDELDELVEVLEESVSGERVADELDDFPIEDLNDEELKDLVKAEDEIFVGELDVHIAKQHYLQNKALTSQGRRKRIAPLIGRAAWTIGRALFRRYGRTHVTRSGSRVTQHYGARGNYQSALNDFNRMNPTNVRSINGRFNGQTGTVGNYRVTVRDGSSKGVSRPTLSVHREGNTGLTRKFRYD